MIFYQTSERCLALLDFALSVVQREKMEADTSNYIDLEFMDAQFIETTIMYSFHFNVVLINC